MRWLSASIVGSFVLLNRLLESTGIYIEMKTFIHSFIYSFINLFIHSIIHSLTTAQCWTCNPPLYTSSLLRTHLHLSFVSWRSMTKPCDSWCTSCGTLGRPRRTAWWTLRGRSRLTGPASSTCSLLSIWTRVTSKSGSSRWKLALVNAILSCTYV